MFIKHLFKPIFDFLCAANVIPPELSATFDIRLSNDVNLEEFEKMVIFAHFSTTELCDNQWSIDRLTDGVKKLAVTLN